MSTEKEVVFITQAELVDLLREVKSATFATFVATTAVKMNKKNEAKSPNPYHDRITKRQKSNVIIKFNYENSVNKARLKEGKEADFVAQSRTWGTHVQGTPLIEHKGEFYLEARFLGNEPAVDYFLDGSQPIQKTEFEPFLPAVKESSGRQDLENEVVMRDFKISGIREIAMNGKRYVRSDV